jgi:hypothetical protein
MHARELGLRTSVAALLVWLMAAGAVQAQEPSKEFWPEIDTWLRLSPAWRVSLFVPVSQNLDTHYREGNLIPQVDYAFGEGRFYRRLMDEDRARTMKLFMVRGGYLGGKSLDDEGEAYTEYQAFGEMHWRLPLKGGLLLSHRVRADLRWLGKNVFEFSNRWRYRLMLEKEISKGRTSFVPYASVEAYYDSRYDTVNRIRIIAGNSVAWSPRTAVEANVTYQYDSRSSTKEILALGVILHVFFDTSHKP